MANGTLSVSRNSPKDIKIRELHLLLDEVEIGNLGFGDSIERSIPAGEHRVTATNRLYSKSEDFAIGEEETVTFETANIASGCGGLMFIVVGMGPYKVRLRRVR